VGRMESGREIGLGPPCVGSTRHESSETPVRMVWPILHPTDEHQQHGAEDCAVAARCPFAAPSGLLAWRIVACSGRQRRNNRSRGAPDHEGARRHLVRDWHPRTSLSNTARRFDQPRRTIFWAAVRRSHVQPGTASAAAGHYEKPTGYSGRRTSPICATSCPVHVRSSVDGVWGLIPRPSIELRLKSEPEYMLNDAAT